MNIKLAITNILISNIGPVIPGMTKSCVWGEKILQSNLARDQQKLY